MLQTFQQCGKLKTRDKMRVPTKHLVQNHSCQRRAKRRRTPFFITNSFTQQVNTLLGYKDWQCKPIWTNLSRDLNCPSWLILSEVMKLRSFTAFSSLVAVRKSAVQAPLARQEKKKSAMLSQRQKRRQQICCPIRCYKKVANILQRLSKQKTTIWSKFPTEHFTVGTWHGRLPARQCYQRLPSTEWSCPCNNQTDGFGFLVGH